jgi:hypothetical protein
MHRTVRAPNTTVSGNNIALYHASLPRSVFD